MAILKHLLLISALVPLVLSYPFYPPTCYTKVLSMARELTQWAADLKRDPETSYCMAHMPNLYIDVHNGCVMHKMSTYIQMVEGLRQRRCAYTRDVRKLGVTMRQLFIIMSERCHGFDPTHLICDVRPIWVCYWCPGMTDLSVQPRPQCLGERTWCSQSLTVLPWSADILDAEIVRPAHRKC